MKKFIAAIVALFMFNWACATASASQPATAPLAAPVLRDTETVVNCQKGQPCHVTLDLRASPPATPLVPPLIQPPPDYTWAWFGGIVLTAVAIVMGSVLITNAIKNGNRVGPAAESQPDVVVDVVLRNPPEQTNGGG